MSTHFHANVLRVFYISLAVFMCGQVFANTSLVSRGQAVVADAKMMELGYDLTEMYSEIDSDNRKWNEFWEGRDGAS